jgi:DNA polymerase-1
MSDDDHVGYSLDLSQAENRIVARVGRVLPMIEAFDRNLDVHSLTASLLFGDSIEDIKHWDDEHVACEIGDGLHTKRYWGKKSNHSLNYDIGFMTFAMDQEIPIKQAKFIIERYHEIYPNVREVFHAEVRQDIMYNRTLTNLMGRKTMFFGKVCDELFKQAYACKPQGTVGDVINERGLNFIYYDERFKNVKLMTQTHDEVVFQIPLSLGWAEHIRLLNLIKSKLETPLRLPNGDEFVIPADIDMFKRFKRGKKVKQLTPTYMKELWEGLEK